MKVWGRGRIVILGFGALFACRAPADQTKKANWLEVGYAKNGVAVYVEAQSVSKRDGWVRLTQRYVFPGGGQHRLGRVDQQVLYGCASKSVETIKSVEFDRAGRVSRVDDGKTVPLYIISPGTLPEYVFDLVCS